MKILKSVYILISYISFANSYFHSSVSKRSLQLGESWRRILQMHQVSVSSPCIKSLYQLFLLSNCIESSISSLGIKSTYQVFHVKSLYKFSVWSLCITFSCLVFLSSLCIKSSYQDLVPSISIKSLYKVFVSRPQCAQIGSDHQYF